MLISLTLATAAVAQEHTEPEHEAAPAPADTGQPEAAELADVPPPAELAHTEQPDRSLLESILADPVPVRGFWGGLGLIALAVAFMALAQSTERLRENLLPTGILPQFMGILQTLLRVSALFAGLGAVGAWVPKPFAWALPLVVAGAAVAVGFFATRDILPDLLAGFTLGVERRIRVGQWLEGEDFSGAVQSIGLRAIWIRDANGRLLAIPNRHLLNATVADVDERFPSLEVLVHVSGEHPSQRVRRVLLEAVLVSPWIAPGDPPSLVRDATEPHLWRVRARLLEGHFADRFEGALRERVEDALRQSA